MAVDKEWDNFLVIEILVGKTAEMRGHLTGLTLGGDPFVTHSRLHTNRRNTMKETQPICLHHSANQGWFLGWPPCKRNTHNRKASLRLWWSSSLTTNLHPRRLHFYSGHLRVASLAEQCHFPFFHRTKLVGARDYTCGDQGLPVASNDSGYLVKVKKKDDVVMPLFPGILT